MSSVLLIIDPQCDFCDGPAQGTLAVPGAWNDMERLARYIDDRGDRFDAIVVTLDSHNVYDIAHPSFWRDAQGNNPPPFTTISGSDVENGRWQPANASQLDWVKTYLQELERSDRYSHTVWPEHCLVGSKGHLVQPAVMKALSDWQIRNRAAVVWYIKGLNPKVENYSALKTEVDDPEDRDTTVTARRLTAMLARYDEIYVAGEALSHCVRYTIEDLMESFSELGILNPERKLHLLTSMMSSIPAIPGGPDFPTLANAFIDGLESKGARVLRVPD